MKLSYSQRALAGRCRMPILSARLQKRGQVFPAGHSRHPSNSTASSSWPLPAAHSGVRALPHSARASRATYPLKAPEVVTGRDPSPQSGVPGDQRTAGSNARAWWISLLPRGRIGSAEILATATVLPS